MTCSICRLAETQPGSAMVTLVRGTLTLVIKGVPAQVCPNCGEEYVEEVAAARLLMTAEQLAQAGAQVDVREYIAG